MKIHIWNFSNLGKKENDSKRSFSDYMYIQRLINVVAFRSPELTPLHLLCGCVRGGPTENFKHIQEQDY
jgi:hypothetical protein